MNNTYEFLQQPIQEKEEKLNYLAQSPDNEEESDVNITPAQQASETIPQYHGVPMDIIRHFDVEIRDLTPQVRERLKDVYNMLEGDNMAEKFQSLIRIELKLGRGSGDITRYNKIWNWLKINKNIKNGINIEKEISKRIALEVSQSGQL